MGILFSAPQAEFDIIEEEWLQELKTAAKRGEFVGGSLVAGFETAFASYLGTREVVGVGNGTDALFLALKALEIGPGDEVITAANTFVATVEAIHHTGAAPVLVDCEPDSYLLDLAKTKQAVTDKTKAIIVVHLYGQMVDLRELQEWAAARGIAIVEDSAQAAGARLGGRAAGSWGTMGCFSFYPDKNLGALGDAGGIASSSEELLAVLRKLRNHGGQVRYQHELPGFNSRLDAIQAAALRLKLRHLDAWSDKRRSAAKLYDAYLAPLSAVATPAHRGDESHVFHLYVVRVPAEARHGLMRHFQKKGILTAIQYPAPVHRTPAFAHLGYGEGDFPVCERYAAEIVSLPMNITIGEREVEAVAKELRSYIGAVHV